MEEWTAGGGVGVSNSSRHKELKVLPSVPALHSHEHALTQLYAAQQAHTRTHTQARADVTSAMHLCCVLVS